VRALAIAFLLALPGAQAALAADLPSPAPAAVERPRETLRDAFPRVRVGMNLADLDRLHPALLGGHVRTLETAGHRVEWRTYDLDPGTGTLELRDGIVVAIVRG
jgi:hypothetical protein